MKRIIFLLILSPFLTHAQDEANSVPNDAVSSVQIADPKVLIAVNENKGALMKDGPIVVGVDGSSLQGKVTLVEFEVGFLQKENGVYQIFHCIGDKYTDAVKDVINNAIAGDKLFVENITVQDPANNRRKMNSIVYVFK